MKARLIAWLLMFTALRQRAEAHRLNEYLQATTISLGQDSIRLHLHLIAGSDVADKVVREIDANGDGFISETDQQAYARFVLQSLFLYLDGKQAALRLMGWSFPAVDAIKKGTGDVQLYLAAALASSQGTHHLTFENHRQQAFSVYLINCLLPADTTIHVNGQSRNYDQSRYTLDFTTTNTRRASTVSQSVIDKADNRAVIKTYFFYGVRHILTGYDHLLFLCALVLGATGLWNLIKTVTAFTVAHSITLTLATLGLAHLPEAIVEPFIAASILCVTVQNIFWPKQSGGRRRLALAFFFGLFHGLGFAGGLLQLMRAMPPQMVVSAMIGFGIGVEAGNQLVLLPLHGVLQSLKRFQTKSMKPKQQPALQRFVSGVVAVAGIYYLYMALAAHL